MILNYVSGCKQDDDELEPRETTLDFSKHLKSNPLYQRSQTIWPAAFFKNQFYWNIVALIFYLDVYGWFAVTMAELSNWDRDLYGPQSIGYLISVISLKNLPTPVL